MKVTAIEINKYKKNTYNVFIDGNYAFGLHLKALEQTGIRKGDILNHNQIKEIIKASGYYDAIDYSRLLLSYRRRTEKELINRLIKKGYSELIAKKVVDVMKKTGDVNDSRFAVEWIRQRRQNKPKGNFAIKMELRKKGISEKKIEQAFQMVNQEKPYDELQLAWKACENMLDKYRSLPKKTAERRLIGYLKRRGFSWDVVNKIRNKYFE
ncbi:MAG: regulatory protein RecX [Elusimicrobiota bacterium]